MRARSDKTEVRRLRTVLRNCGAAIDRVEAESRGSASHGLSMLRDCRRSIREALEPKRRRPSEGGR